jgi:adenylate cyclase
MFAAIHLVASDLRWLRQAETVSLDMRLRLRGAIAPAPELAIVIVDDASVAEIGRWPVPRRLLAGVIDRLDWAGARVIGIDMLFAERQAPALSHDYLTPAQAAEIAAVLEAQRRGDLARAVRQAAAGRAAADIGGADDDSALAAAIARAGRVVLPFAFQFGSGAVPAGAATSKPFPTPSPAVARSAYATVRRDSGDPPPLQPTATLDPIAPLAEAAAALGHASVALDADGVARYDYPVVEYGIDYYPSMPIRLAQLYVGASWDGVAVDPRRGGLSLGPLTVPLDDAMRVLANPHGPARTFPTHSFADVLRGAVSDEAFRDRVVLVGTSVLGVQDGFDTPFGTIPGVERLAALTGAVLHGTHLRRPAWAGGVEAVLLLLAGLAIGAAVARLSIARATAAAAALLIAVLGGGQFALAHYGLWFAAATPTAAILTCFTVAVIYRHGLLDGEHRRVRHAFARYLSPAMVHRLADRPEALRLGGEQREVTVLFCDIRDFITLSERLGSERLTGLLNRYFEPMTEVILAHGGTVDKYIGDAVMAFWNAPITQPDHTRRACRAALDMLRALDDLNRELARSDPDLGPITIGIGINTGTATVGNFGSRRRFDYSAVGDTVNVAARLEAETKTQLQPILIGPATAAQIAGAGFALRSVGAVRLRGRAQAVQVTALVGDGDAGSTVAPAASVPLPVPSPLV